MASKSIIADRARIAASKAAELRRNALSLPASDPILAALKRVKRWQLERLQVTHADLLRNPRYSDAATFFLNELYAGSDLIGRDKDVVRLLPVMVKLLPAAALETIVQALELDALSEQLDWNLAKTLAEKFQTGRAIEALSRDDFKTAYAAAYRAMPLSNQRSLQTKQVLEIGSALERLVRQPLLGGLLKSMSAPAKVAGLTSIHTFLMNGFAAFKKMGPADEFLRLIVEREIAEDLRLRTDQ